MRHQLIRAFSGSIHMQRMIYAMLLRERHCAVGTVDTRARSIDKILDLRLLGKLDQITKSNEIGVHIGTRILERVAYTSLSCEIADPINLFFCKYSHEKIIVLEKPLVKGKSRNCLKDRSTSILDRDIIVVVLTIDTHDSIPTSK